MPSQYHKATIELPKTKLSLLSQHNQPVKYEYFCVHVTSLSSPLWTNTWTSWTWKLLSWSLRWDLRSPRVSSSAGFLDPHAVCVVGVQFADGVYLVLLMGLLEDYFVPLYNFFLTPESFEQKVSTASISEICQWEFFFFAAYQYIKFTLLCPLRFTMWRLPSSWCRTAAWRNPKPDQKVFYKPTLRIYFIITRADKIHT